MALYRVVPVDGSAPSKTISALNLQIYPSSLTNTRVVALSKDGSAVKVEDIELASATSTIVFDGLLSAVSVDATGLHFGDNQEIHRSRGSYRQSHVRFPHSRWVDRVTTLGGWGATGAGRAIAARRHRGGGATSRGRAHPEERRRGQA